jgi:hypothetical protein
MGDRAGRTVRRNGGRRRLPALLPFCLCAGPLAALGGASVALLVAPGARPVVWGVVTLLAAVAAGVLWESADAAGTAAQPAGKSE